MADNRNGALWTYLERRRSSLEKERVSFDSHWRSLAEYIQPRRSRFFVSERNKGQRMHNTIVNSAGTYALRSATAGLFAGIMSPSRPWFALGLDDTQMMENPEVAGWLKSVEKLIYNVFSGSNLYNQAPVALSELLLFGTGCLLDVDDDESVSRYYTQTVGSYYLAQNNKREINTFLRKYEMSVGALVEQFGIDNVSTSIRTLYERGQYDNWFEVGQLIEPRRDRSIDNPFNTNKAYRSIYYLIDDNEKRILKESGYDYFPVYAPRWGTTGEDIYGTDCPGMVVLGDVRQIQHQEKRKQQAIDKMVNPPLKGPAALRNQEVTGLPNSLVLYDSGVDNEGLAPVYLVNPQLQELVADIEKTEKRIQDGFFLDLFLAITNIPSKQYKNELELQQRNDERLLQLGPVLEQLHGEFLDKLIDRTFSRLAQKNMLPEPPQELEGTPLNVNYISSLALAQRAVATQAIEKIGNFVAGMAQIVPSVVDKFNADQAVDEYSQAILGPPKIVRSDEEVEQMREEQAELQQQQAMMEQAQAMMSMTKEGAEAASAADG